MNNNFRQFVVLVAASALFLTPALANPLAGVVANGAANINPAGNLLTINQASDRAIINWGSFNIANGETTLFQFNGLAGANSAVLNRVNIGNPSTIAGMLRSTVGPGGPIGGTVMVLNPSGMLFTPTAQINVGSFVATTLGLADDRQFLNAGTLSLSSSSTAGIRNQGNITGLGDVFLIAHTVQNAGNITAGNVAGLAAGTTVTLAEAGNERLTVQAGTPGTGASIGVDNTAAGRINATAAELKAAGGNIYALAINNGGVVRATSLVNQNGRISLRAAGGNIRNSGTLSAHNADGSGGTIIVDGGHNAAAPSTVISSGTIAARGDAAGTKGGTVEVLGDHVGLFDRGVVDVSGQAGGGTALIGGDLHGANPAIQNAQATVVGPDFHLNADAVTSGNGGKVVVWADGADHFYGSISARGGSSGGNGGFVEVSGKNTLDFQGAVDTRAPAGKAGTLLLDPATLTITEGSTAGDQDGNLNSILAGAPDTPLNTVSQGALEAVAGNNNVVLEAQGLITINDLSAGGGSGVLNMQQSAGFSLRMTSTTSGGILFQNVNNEIRTAGGDITLQAQGSGSLTLGKLTAGGGNIDLESAASLTFNNNVTAASLTSHSGTSGSGDTTFGPGVTIQADTQSYQAGDGHGGAGSAAVVNLVGNAPTFQNTAGVAAPGSFTYRQDGAIAATDLPGAAQFGGTPPAAYVIRSDDNGVQLPAITLPGTLQVTASGNITENGALDVSGGASTFSIDTVTANVLLGSQANDFGNQLVTVNAINGGAVQDAGLRNVDVGAVMPSVPATGLRDLTLAFDSAGIVLPALTLSGNLNVTAGGAITESGVLTVNGAGKSASFTAGAANDITLDTQNNDFTSVSIVSGKDVAVKDVNGIALGASTVSGSLTVTANGEITESGALTVTAGGSTFHIDTGTADVLLGSQANDFGNQLVTIDAINGGTVQDVSLRNVNAAAVFPALPSGLRDLTLAYDAAGIVLPALTLSGNLSVTAGGAITESGVLTVNGAGKSASFTAGAANDITLDTQNNDFTSVSIVSGKDVAIKDVNGIDLGASTVSGNLAVTASGAVSQSGAATVSGTANVSAGANGITLNNGGNDFVGAVTVNNSGANDVNLNNGANALTVGGSVGT